MFKTASESAACQRVIAAKTKGCRFPTINVIGFRMSRTNKLELRWYRWIWPLRATKVAEKVASLDPGKWGWIAVVDEYGNELATYGQHPEAPAEWMASRLNANRGVNWKDADQYSNRQLANDRSLKALDENQYGY